MMKAMAADKKAIPLEMVSCIVVDLKRRIIKIWHPPIKTPFYRNILKSLLILEESG
jgi:hypothetical protein